MAEISLELDLVAFDLSFGGEHVALTGGVAVCGGA